MLCGLPFAGKSSLAAALRSAYGYHVIALDAINHERGLGINAAPIDVHQWDETYAEGYRRHAAAMAAGETVIFDAPSYTRTQRDELRRVAAAYGASASMLYLAVPAAVCRERLLRNRQAGARFEVRDADFENVAADFEAPMPDEQVIVYDQSALLAIWIGRTFGSSG